MCTERGFPSPPLIDRYLPGFAIPRSRCYPILTFNVTDLVLIHQIGDNLILRQTDFEKLRSYLVEVRSRMKTVGCSLVLLRPDVRRPKLEFVDPY